MLSSDAIRGHLDSIILKLIVEKDRYGYEMSQEIINRTDGSFQVKEATLYAVFQRLEKKDLIESYYGDVSHGSKRKYYRITSLGRAYFVDKKDEWENVKEIMDIFMEA